jgi:hypothetical protein
LFIDGASINNESFSKRHSDIFETPWFSDLKNELNHFSRIAARLSVLSSLCSESSRSLRCVKRIGNRKYLIRACLLWRTYTVPVLIRKIPKHDAVKQKEIGLSCTGRLYDGNKKDRWKTACNQFQTGYDQIFCLWICQFNRFRPNFIFGSFKNSLIIPNLWVLQKFWT